MWLSSAFFSGSVMNMWNFWSGAQQKIIFWMRGLVINEIAISCLTHVRLSAWPRESLKFPEITLLWCFFYKIFYWIILWQKISISMYIENWEALIENNPPCEVCLHSKNNRPSAVRWRWCCPSIMVHYIKKRRSWSRLKSTTDGGIFNQMEIISDMKRKARSLVVVVGNNRIGHKTD